MAAHASALSGAKQDQHRRARQLEWTTIGIITVIIGLMYLTLGGSQAMKSVLIEDILSLVPPAAFLFASRFHTRPASKDFPYGYHRAIAIAFLCGAAALCIFGGYLLYASVILLVTMEHPTIGTISILGLQFWHGWLMIAVLAITAVPPVILGRMKLKLAHELHDKALSTDADMNKADWTTAGAACVGILGVGSGLWWSDAVAAALISLSILRDGVKHMGQVIFDLMDMVPTTIGSNDPDPLPDQLELALKQLDWVAGAEVRLREAGHVFIGEARVLVRDETNLLDRIEAATRDLKEMNPRLHDFSVIPVRTLQRDGADGGEGHGRGA